MNTKCHYVAASALLLAIISLAACGGAERSADEPPAGDQAPAEPGDKGSGDGATGAAAGGGESTPTAASRGTIDLANCSSGEPISVDPNAVAAVYFDSQGHVVGTGGEDLTGTTENKMCPTPEPSEPGTCQSGYCARMIGGRKVCMPC